MNIIDENKYRELKNILSGCSTFTDAALFGELYRKKNPEMKTLIYGFLKGRRYLNNKDFITMQNLLERCNNCIYTEDVYQIINDNFPNRNNENDIQYQTLIRIAKNKVSKFTSSNAVPTNSSNRVLYPFFVKKCPHCGNPFHGNSETNYVVCGYNNITQGYDWVGCQNDWCFVCGKMLCKSWERNKLFVESNRIHDSECCKKHAKLHNKSYLDEYCQCQYKYVIRTKNCSITD